MMKRDVKTKILLDLSLLGSIRPHYVPLVVRAKMRERV